LRGVGVVVKKNRECTWIPVKKLGFAGNWGEGTEKGENIGHTGKLMHWDKKEVLSKESRSSGAFCVKGGSNEEKKGKKRVTTWGGGWVTASGTKIPDAGVGEKAKKKKRFLTGGSGGRTGSRGAGGKFRVGGTKVPRTVGVQFWGVAHENLKSQNVLHTERSKKGGKRG